MWFAIGLGGLVLCFLLVLVERPPGIAPTVPVSERRGRQGGAHTCAFMAGCFVSTLVGSLAIAVAVGASEISPKRPWPLTTERSTAWAVGWTATNCATGTSVELSAR